MAIGISYKSSVYQTTNTASSFAGTPTWTPQANSLLVCMVCTAYSATPSDPTAVSGHGVSYSKLTLGTSTLSTTHKLSIWVAKAGASPTSAAPTATVTSTNGTGDLLIEFEVTGHDNNGTALQAIVDSTATNSGASGTSATVTLSSPGNANNRAMTFIVQLSNAKPTAAGTWTIDAGASGNFTNPATGAAGLYDTGSFNTAGAATVASGASWRMVGIEIKADPNVVLTPGAGSVTITGATPTLSVNSTTLYYVIGPSSGWSDPTAAEIKAGQLSGGGAATAFGAEASPTSSTTDTFSTAASGLSAGTAYKIAFVWSNGTDNSNVAVGSFSTTGGGGTTITVSAGTVTISGATPVALRGTIAVPSAGSVSVTGATPAAVRGTVIAVGPATITCTGSAPTVVRGTVIAPSAGTVTVTGAAPTVLRGTVMQPAAGAATITGPPPTVILGTVLQPAAGSITATGSAPSVSSGAVVSPAAGSISISGATPSLLLGTVSQPAAGSIAVSGATPALVAGTVAQPDAGTITITGATPTASASSTSDTTSTPAAGSITITGSAPTVIVGTIIQPGAGTVTLAGEAPVAIEGTIAAPGAGAITATGAAPTVVRGTVRQPAGGAIAVTGTTPRAIVNTIIQPGAGEITTTGEAPEVTTGQTAYPDAGEITVEGATPTVRVDKFVSPAAGSVTITGTAPVVRVNHLCQPGPATISVDGEAPQLRENVIARPGAGTVTITGVAPTVATSQPAATALSGKHAAWLEALARVNGLIDPLTVSATERTDGTLIQSIADAGDSVTVSPVAVPSGDEEPSALTPQQAHWLEALMRVHGLLDPLVVTATDRGDGTLAQTIATAGGTTTVTRTA